MRDAQFSSKAYGTHDYKEITCEGRTQFDLLTAIQRDHKLSSYSLNAASAAASSQHSALPLLIAHNQGMPAIAAAVLVIS